MPNLIVGFAVGVMTACCGVAHASTDTEFYNINGQVINTDSDGNSGKLYVQADEGCAVPSGLEIGDTVYSCNGGCSLSASRYNIVNIPPNGSKFHGGPSISSSDSLGEILGTGITYPNYVCTLEGKWEPCAQVEKNNIPLNGDLVYAIELRKYTAIGYCDGEVWSASDVQQGDLEDFCSMPYEYYNNYVYSQVSDCVYTVNTASGVQTYYDYDGCATGYKLTGATTAHNRRCESCGTAPSNGTYNYTASGYHTKTTCEITCNAGYVSNGTSCVKAGDKSYYPASDCGYGYFNNSAYYGEDECVPCPDNAKCDGEYIYCAAGFYGVAPDDGDTVPYCAECPLNGNLRNASPWNTYGWDDGVGMLYSCSGQPMDFMKGIPTDCMYNDYWVDNASDASYCEAYRGEDKTGKYFWGEEGQNSCYYGD